MISGEKMFEDGENSLQVTNYTWCFQIFWFAACKVLNLKRRSLRWLKGYFIGEGFQIIS